MFTRTLMSLSRIKTQDSSQPLKTVMNQKIETIHREDLTPMADYVKAQDMVKNNYLMEKNDLLLNLRFTAEVFNNNGPL